MDFQEVYSLDLTDRLLRQRSAAWLKVRLAGLLQTTSRLHTYFYPPKPMNVTIR